MVSTVALLETRLALLEVKLALLAREGQLLDGGVGQPHQSGHRALPRTHHAVTEVLQLDQVLVTVGVDLQA